MNDIAISVKNLSKKYRLYESPQHRLKEALHPFRKKYHRDFWALKDISLEIKNGESLGIIGQNGSGKSTLLQTICGVLQPSAGLVVTNGRISALLELGSGFNPEFTGRQNVYMNGAILGFSREDIDKKIQSVVDFADIGDYIEQPIKTYSTGMYVRLAFAVAVNVDPDILIVDEALAVGDMRFQFKCFRKMKEFKEQGKTFLFVTHSVETVRNFCDRVIWLRDGEIYQDGDPKEITRNYMNYMTINLLPTKAKNGLKREQDITERIDGDGIQWEPVSDHSSVGAGGARIKKVAFYVIDQHTRKFLKSAKILKGEEWLAFLEEVEIYENLEMPTASIYILNELGNHIFSVNKHFLNVDIPPLIKGDKILFRFEFKLPLLKNGKYSIVAGVADGTYGTHVRHHTVHEAAIFQIVGELISQRHQYITIEDAYIKYEKILNT